MYAPKPDSSLFSEPSSFVDMERHAAGVRKRDPSGENLGRRKKDSKDSSWYILTDLGFGAGVVGIEVGVIFDSTGGGKEDGATSAFSSFFDFSGDALLFTKKLTGNLLCFILCLVSKREFLDDERAKIDTDLHTLAQNEK